MAALYPLFNRRSTLSARTRLLLYNTLMTYASSTFSNQAHTHVKRLQVIRNKALKIVFDSPFYSNITKLHTSKNIPI
jgi:hypothetical protein